METLNGADEQVRWEGRCGVMPISDIRPARTDPSNSQAVSTFPKGDQFQEK